MWTVVKKTTNESRTNNTLADDSTLLFALAANTTYAIRLRVFFSTAATPDFQYGIEGPTGSVYLGATGGRAAGGATPAWFVVRGVYTVGGSITLLGSATQGMIFEDAIVQNGATPGDWRFRWAQNTTNATPAIVRAGSYIEYLEF